MAKRSNALVCKTDIRWFESNCGLSFNIMKVFNSIDDIKVERINNRKNLIIYNLLGTLLGEIDRILVLRTDVPSPEQIYGVIKKMHESASIMKDYSHESLTEYNYLSEFIKSQLSEEDLKKVILESNLTKIGDIMKYLKDNYNGQYDGKLASKIIKEILS